MADVMTPFLIVAAAIALIVVVLRHGLRKRVIYRNNERPNLVVMQARWHAAFLLDAVGRCMVCGWQSDEKWNTRRQIEEYLLPDLKRHRCPTLEEASKPKEWETL